MASKSSEKRSEARGISAEAAKKGYTVAYRRGFNEAKRESHKFALKVKRGQI